MDPYTVLIETVRPREVTLVRQALGEARIPYRTGLLADDPPRVVISVPGPQLDLAQTVIAPHVVPDGWLEGNEPADDPEPDEIAPDSATEAPAKFPTRPVAAVAAVVAIHLGVVAVMTALPEVRDWLLQWCSLRGVAMVQPWRFVTSLFLHGSLSHALWNGVSMMVFAVPLVVQLGYLRTGLIYLTSGIGGGVTALAFAHAGTIIIGSSGAVAGLFGAWVILKYASSAGQTLPWRHRIRTLGIGLLVLPSLLNPVSASGQAISVESHMGGFVTGMLIGAAISGGLLARMRGEPVDLEPSPGPPAKSDS